MRNVANGIDGTRQKKMYNTTCTDKYFQNVADGKHTHTHIHTHTHTHTHHMHTQKKLFLQEIIFMKMNMNRLCSTCLEVHDGGGTSCRKVWGPGRQQCPCSLALPSLADSQPAVRMCM